MTSHRATRAKQAAAGLGLATALTLAATTPGCPEDRDAPPKDCPAQVVQVDHVLPYQPEAASPTTFDARDDTFTVGKGMYLKFRPTSYRAFGACWWAGDFRGNLNSDTRWEDAHRNGAIIIDTPGVTIRDATLSNVGDGIGVTQGGDAFSVEGVHIDRAYDDGLQLDAGRSGIVSDSLIEAWSLVSARSPDMDGTGETVTIADTLFRLTPYRNAYKCDDIPTNCGRSGGAFKWSSTEANGIPPKLVLRDVVIRADSEPIPGTGTTDDVDGDGRLENVGLGLPAGSECSGDIVLLGDGWTLANLHSWVRCNPTVIAGTAGDIRWNAEVDVWTRDHERAAA